MFESTTVDPWSMEVAKPSDGGVFNVPPKGNQMARIVGLFDVGHVPEQNDKGENVDVRKLVIVFELAKRDDKGGAFYLAQEYRWSMRTNSNFYDLVRNLVGEKKEGERFDPRELAGLPCLVMVNHIEREKNGAKRTYANLGNVTSVPEGFPELPPPARTPEAWSVFEGRPLPDTSWTPYFYGKTVRMLVESSAEYKSGMVPRDGGQPSDEGEEIPF